jgi:polyvinyl alcohol dehydrogenase (cytochrome)
MQNAILYYGTLTVKQKLRAIIGFPDLVDGAFCWLLLFCQISMAQTGASHTRATGQVSLPPGESYFAQTPLSEAAAIGKNLYLRQCAKCHELGTLPLLNRFILKKMSAEYIVRALTTGIMRNQAASLNAGEREAIAEFLTGKSVIKFGTIQDGAGSCSPAASTSAGVSWNGWGVDLQNTRFQPSADARLTAEQVQRLKLKWAFGYPGLFAAYSQPAVKVGRVFVGGPLGQVYALDARTGCTYWVFQALGGVRGAVTIGPGETAYFGDTRAYVYAVDSKSGNLIWKQQVDDHPLARVTSSVKLYDGRLYLGISSREEWLSASLEYECCTFRGSVVALDAKTGKILWKTHMISAPPKPIRKNSFETQLYGPSGAGVWGSPTIDEKLKVLYVGTGDNYTEPPTELSDSIVALNLQNGTVVWSRQITLGDAFNGGCLQEDKSSCPKKPGPDFDFGASTIFRTLPSGRRILIAGQKSGTVYALDPDNKGEILWQTKVGGGGVLGGVQWGMASDTDRVFAAVSDIGLNAGADGFEPNPKAGGGLHAVALADGKKLWDVLPHAEGCKTPPL